MWRCIMMNVFGLYSRLYAVALQSHGMLVQHDLDLSSVQTQITEPAWRTSSGTSR
jgi:hypothetical protein